MMSYYKGDPGFFSVIKGIGSSLASFIPGVGPIASKVISAIPTGVRTMGTKAASAARGAIVKHPVISAAGAAGALALGSAEAGRMSVGGRAGYHPSKRHLHALAMGLRRAKPRMNVTNVHALRRSLRRAHGFAKLAMKVIHITHPKKKGHFAGFRKGRSKK